MPADFISGLGNRGSVVHAVLGAEARGLSPDESKLAAAAGPGATLEDVIQRSGLPESHAIALLLGLRLRGIIQPGQLARPGSTAPRPPATVPPRAPPRPVALDQAALAEKVDLEDAQKREILEMEARLSTDHFTLLGLAAGAAPAQAKSAYYELTRRFHPDRFFGKQLGSYRNRVDTIFKRITEAQAVLTDPNRRAAYLQQHPELAPAPEPVAHDDTRASERRARLAHHPYLAKHAKLHDLVERGKGWLAQKEWGHAFSDLNLASQMDPKSREIATLLAEAKKGQDQLRASKEFELGASAEQMGDITVAVSRFKTAFSLDPDSSDYAHRAARLLADGGETELKEALPMARRAAELKPGNADYRLTFGRVLARLAMFKNALREFEAVLKLKPDNAVAKEQVKKLKWKV